MKSFEIHRINNYLRKIVYKKEKLITQEELNNINKKKIGKYILENVLKTSIYMKKDEYLAYIEFQMVYIYLCEYMKIKHPYLSKKTIKNMILKKELYHIEGVKNVKWNYIKEKNTQFQKYTESQEEMIKRNGYYIVHKEDFAIWEAGRCIKFLTGQTKQKPGYFDYFLISSGFSSDNIKEKRKGE